MKSGKTDKKLFLFVIQSLTRSHVFVSEYSKSDRTDVFFLRIRLRNVITKFALIVRMWYDHSDLITFRELIFSKIGRFVESIEGDLISVLRFFVLVSRACSFANPIPHVKFITVSNCFPTRKLKLGDLRYRHWPGSVLDDTTAVGILVHRIVWFFLFLRLLFLTWLQIMLIFDAHSRVGGIIRLFTLDPLCEFVNGTYCFLFDNIVS